MRLKCVVILYLVPGLITILCHASSLATVFPSLRVTHKSSEKEFILLMGSYHPENPPAVLGKKTKSDHDSITAAWKTHSNIPANGEKKRTGDHRKSDVEVPVITGQNPDPITITEDQSFTINFSHILVSSTDSNYPEGFQIIVSSGPNYTVSGNTVTPTLDYTGPLSIPVAVREGDEESNTYPLQITVSPVNDNPVITAQTPNPLTTLEEQAITIQFNHLVVSDNTYPAGFTLSVSSGSGYSVSGNTIFPEANFSGVLSVPVTVSNGEGTSDPFPVQISVSEVNDVPVITGQVPNPLITGEEEPIAIQLTHLLVSDPDDSYPAGFTLIVSEGNNYTVSGTTITPSADFSGTLSVPVTVNDGKAISNTFALAVEVSGANDRPVITGQSPLSVEEDNAITILLSHLQVTDSDNPYPTGFTLAIASGGNYTVSDATVTPAENFSGDLIIPVTVNDGTSTSNPFNLFISVTSVNDAPVITAQSDLTIGENQSVQLDFSHFTVVDPDNAYPAGFTLSVLPGTNYSVTGTTITPLTGFSGVLSVGVSVNDGTHDSNVFMMQITVTPVNDSPVITGQGTLTVPEDNSLTLQLSDLTVTDPDNVYPNGFSLIVLAGSNYAFSGSTIIPAQNFTGPLLVNVQVNDGTDNSQVFAVQIGVTPINDAPQIAGQQSLSTNEDQALTLDLNHLLVSDPDNSYPSGFSLLVFAGSDYTLSATTIIPSADFQGTLSVPVQVSDGALNSNIFELQIIVNATNDPPIITGQTPLSTAEDTPVAIGLSHLTVLDSDNFYPTGFTLTISPGTNYTVSGTTITPVQDFSGTLNVSVMVNDGTSNSAPFVFQIQVGDANDPPVITGQVALSTNEEEVFILKLSDLTVTDPDNQYPMGFSLLIAPGENFTVAGSTITPAINFSGVLTIPVRVNDGVNNSATFSLSLTVNQVNDSPSFDAIPNQSVAENGTPADVMISNISKGPGEDNQQLTLVATSGNAAVIPNPVIIYNGTGNTAILRYKPVANASGIVPITIVAIDNGVAGAPHQNTYSASFQVNVSEINSAPTLDALNNLTVPEDAGLQTISLRGITAGAGETQPLSIEVSASNAELFETLQVAYVSPEATGSLQLKSKPNAYGSAIITVKVTDNGSSTSPSVNSVSRTFTFTVNAVNDPPVFISAPVSISAVNEMYEYVLEISDLENKSLPFSAPSKPGWVSITGMGNGKARLSGIPPASAVGSHTVRVIVTDGEFVTEQQFVLVVNTRPTVKSFSINANEDTGFTFQNQFQQAYSDAENHPMASVLITQVPAFGTLTVSSIEIKSNDTISASDLASLIYEPDLNYAGLDAFYWKGFDGYHHSAVQVSVDIAIQPVNDPPTMLLETDTLLYEVNGEPAPLTSLFAIEDPDDDSLMHAEVSFGISNFLPEYDLLSFQSTSSIKGFYDYTVGKLSLTGLASLSEYAQAIRSILYNHLNTLDPDLKMKSVFIVLNDGEASSEEKERLIMLQYTFVELEIPSGFTPNGDQSNDHWIISRPGGVEQLMNAEIKVFNRRGIQVYRAKGFTDPWDGTLNGEVLPADTYFYMIDLNLRSKKTYRGIVTILR